MKSELYQRGDLETNAFMDVAGKYSNEKELVEKEFFNIKPMASKEEYIAWINKFASYLNEELDILKGIALVFGGSTKVPFAGKKIKENVNPIIQQALNISEEPDWGALRKDIKTVQSTLIPKYKEVEYKIADTRYS